jgi:transcriptional regulator with XRE-family HTH domain
MDERELRGILSGNIKRCRKRKKLSQMALAEKIDMSPNFVSEIEQCKTWISPLTLVKLAAALNIEPYELFKTDEFFSDRERNIIEKYADENLKAVMSVVNKLRGA